MASSSTSAVSGLISGIDYRSLVDQIITNEGAGAKRLRDQEKRLQDQVTAIGKYRELVAALQTATKALQDGSAFDAVSTSIAALSGSRAVVSASGAKSAAAGAYRVGVTQLARAQKLGSGWASGATTALGLGTGSFSVNGATISVDANDTLASIRDKINGTNSGTSASKVSASILQVSDTNYRLVLTSDITGAAGMTLTDVTGTTLQSLGFKDANGGLLPSATLLAGADAQFTVDGIAMTRSTNTITDAIQGVTLNLQAEEVGAITSVTVERSLDGAQKSMQAFADAWNKLVDFVKEQQKPPKEGAKAPTLYNEALLRTVSGTLSRTLLQTIAGAPADLSTAGLAGLSLGQDGKLTLNTPKFEAAFKGRLNDLRVLFSQVGSATDSRVSYISSGAATRAGTYAVNITQAATQATLLGASFGGSYADDATADTMTVTDKSTGVAVSIGLTNGMTAGDIATALSNAFGGATKQKLATGTVLYGDVAGTVPMTAATKFSELRSAGGGTLGIVDGQTISVIGKRGDGTSLGITFAITSAATLTVGDLVTQIQAAYGSSASVSVSGGQIVVEDSQARTSQLTLTLTANNEGGGTLDFGATTTLATGRPAVPLSASTAGGQVQIRASDFGSASGFTVAYAAGGADGTAQLGLAAGSYAGLDVQGTIGGFEATGTGRTLVGDQDTVVEGLTLAYTGTAAEAAGNVSITLGTGALLQRALDGWLEANSGVVAKKESALNNRVKTLEDRALMIDARLDRRRESLLKQFAQMESAIGRLQQASSSVTAMLQSFNKSNS